MSHKIRTARQLYRYTHHTATVHVQCSYTVPKIIQNLRIKTKPVTAGAEATVYFWILLYIFKGGRLVRKWHKCLNIFLTIEKIY